jgi:hypothetical protein
LAGAFITMNKDVICIIGKYCYEFKDGTFLALLRTNKKTYSTGKEVFSLVLEQSNIPVEHCTKKFLLASELIKTLPKFMNGNPEAQRKYYSSSHIKNLIRNYITAHSSEVINSI